MSEVGNYRRRMRTRLLDWLAGDFYKAVEQSTWLGVRALKNPMDAWVYQEIIFETRPDTILELGSAFGGGRNSCAACWT